MVIGLVAQKKFFFVTLCKLLHSRVVLKISMSTRGLLFVLLVMNLLAEEMVLCMLVSTAYIFAG